jgi:hypothetical protein
MSLLTIANAVADETKGPRPETIATNTDPAAQNILRLINKVAIRMMLVYNWNILRKEHAFTASGNEIVLASANIPADFNRFVTETFWDRGSNNLVSGPVSPVEWQGLKVQTFSSSNKKFIFRGGDVYALPIFATGTSLSFEYVSDKWAVAAADGSKKTSFTIDTDTALINEELIIYGTIFEWLSAEGQPAGVAAKQFQDHFNLMIDNDTTTANIAVTGDIFAQNTRHFTGDPKASRSSYGGDF